MTARGYAAIALDNPKHGSNVGGAMRAAQVYGAGLIVVSGPRAKAHARHPTDTMKAWRHVPLLLVGDVFEVIPYGCVPVAVEILPGAQPLPSYEHPERAFYIFGGEDATLGRRVTERCRDRVFVPTNGCMNLAATVNVVLYDRMAKDARSDRR